MQTLVSVIRGHYHICEHARRLRIDSNDVYRNCGDEEEMEIVEYLLCSVSTLSSPLLEMLRTLYLRWLTDLDRVDVWSVCFQ